MLNQTCRARQPACPWLSCSRALTGAGAAWGGPVTAFAVCALAGGVGVLLMAIIEPRLRRS
jgi:hypothetical protein